MPTPPPAQLFGMAKRDLLQASIADFADPNIDVKQLWREFLEADRMARSFRIHRPDGTVREAEFFWQSRTFCPVVISPLFARKARHGLLPRFSN